MPLGERYRYSREANPTVEELARIISSLEVSQASTCFSSGMGSITTTLLSLLRPGKRLVLTRDCFARTFRFATEFLRNFGVEVIVSDPGTDSLIESSKNADIIFFESISNPILRVYDIPEIRKSVPESCTIVVDSTLATPHNQRPISQGADLVLHSLSKFMSGHNDIIGGSASGNSRLIELIDGFRRTLGTSMDPNTAFLVIRGLKTIFIRMERINANALKIARMLEEDGKFTSVKYPGLESHCDHGIAKRVLSGYGGIITFDIPSLTNDVFTSFKKLHLVEPANTLGGVNSTISHPATMSHRSLSNDERKLLGFTSRTFRLSVGLEDPDAVYQDLRAMAS